MARYPEVRYINMYNIGSAARKIELAEPIRENKTTLPESRPMRKRVLRVDPLALGSIALSAVMLVLMLAGAFQLYTAGQQEKAARDYVQQLYAQNQQLKEDYTSGYDLEQIERNALALGMVPVDQVTHLTVSLEQIPVNIQAEPTAWDALCAFFASIFA